MINPKDRTSLEKRNSTLIKLQLWDQSKDKMINGPVEQVASRKDPFMKII